MEVVTVEHPTFETVWAALQETDRMMKENAKEADRRMKEIDRRMQENAERQKEIDQLQKETAEQMKDTDRRMQETAEQMKETDRQMKKLGLQMGDLHNRFGEIAEHLVRPGIVRRFNERGFHFDEISPSGVRITDEQGIKTRTEIDFLLANGEYIVAVEIKVKPKVQDIEHHERRLEILRETRNKKNDRRQIWGAIAGAIYEPEVKKAVAGAGFYVIEQSGDTMKIDVPDGFVPREW